MQLSAPKKWPLSEHVKKRIYSSSTLFTLCEVYLKKLISRPSAFLILSFTVTKMNLTNKGEQLLTCGRMI